MGICIDELLVDFVLDWYGIDWLLFGTLSVYLTNAEHAIQWCSIFAVFGMVMWVFVCGLCVDGYGVLVDCYVLAFLAHGVFMWEFVSVDFWRILYLFDTILTCFCYYSFDVLVMFLYRPVHQSKAWSYIILNKSK